MMKKSAKITMSASIAALSVVAMLLSYFPYFTYAVPAFSGLFIMVALIETGAAYALGAYVVSALLALLICEKESAVLYLCLFGFYPVLKAVLEKMRKPVLEWIIKMLALNASIFVSYLIASFAFGISYSDLGELMRYGAIVFVALCNIVFVLYDIAVSRVAMFYMARLHPQINKIFQK